MLKDPLYLQFIDQVVAEVRIEGGYRKPEWNEFLLLQVVYLPLHLYQFAVKYHRRYISKEVSILISPCNSHSLCVCFSYFTFSHK